jgi:eukaryotic-like serine/threonine-protein kinase
MQYGRYQIVKELGKGNMGVVYQAHDPQIDRSVALKVLRPDRVVSEAFVTRFVKEARAIGRLSHPHIVTVYDVGEDHGTIYIAMEYLQGEPFNDVIHSGRLSVAQSVDIARQIAEALDYAHAKGIVHRDIKPSNIILDAQNRVKLTDFGIARIEDAAAAGQTQAGEILGTPIYMSPEQVMGQSVDGRSDLYSLGVIVYEMVSGRRPFTGNNIAALFRAITQDTPESPADIDPFVPKKLSDAIMRSLAKQPENRFQTGREMAAALGALSAVLAQEAKPARRPTRRKGTVIAAAIFVLILFSLGGYWMLNFRQSSESLSGSQVTIAVPVEGTTTVEPADAQPIVQPVAEPALLSISSEPPAAQVYIDNLLKGTTPLELALSLGKYEVRVNLPEYLEWEGQINLEDPGRAPLHVQLMRLQ